MVSSLAIAALLALPIDTERKDATPIDATTAFEMLQGLVGTWKGSLDGVPYEITYHLTGAGSAVVETYFPGSEHEMLTIYHLDGDALRLTHYCAAGNQPRMVLDQDASTDKTLVFTFDGGSNLDPTTDMHIHEGQITFKGPNQILGEWTAHMQGKPMPPQPFDLQRK